MHIDANRKLVGPKKIFFSIKYSNYSFSAPIVFLYCFHFIFSPKFSKLVDAWHYKENNWLDHAISVKLSTESLLIRKHLSVKQFCYFSNGYFTTDLIDNMRHSAHLVPKPFDPWTSGPPREMIPIKLIPLDQQSPSNLVPLDKWSPTNLVPIFLDPYSLSPWTHRIF